MNKLLKIVMAGAFLLAGCSEGPIVPATSDASVPDASSCVPETATQFCARLAGAGKVCGTIADTDPCTGAARSEDCGTTACKPGESCQAATNTCQASCEPETKEAFCARLAAAGKACGTVAGQDGCTGADRSEDCGTAACTGGTVCDFGANACKDSCTPEGQEQFCARLAAVGKVCGAVTQQDNCTGAARTEDCGTAACTDGKMCDFAANACVSSCTAETTAQFCARMNLAGKVCGRIDDKHNCTGAARSEDCGTAACTGATPVCDPATNACTAACVHETKEEFCARLATAGKVCGSITDEESCTGAARTEDCGSAACTGNTTCDAASNTCLCVAETDAEFCARQATAGKVCGAITALDTCGASKTVDCGTAACTGGQTCNAVTNVCQTVCTPETTEQFCARLAGTGKVCGVIADQHNCTGAARSEDCGSAACTGNTACEAATNTCQCVAETDSAFCARQAAAGKVCGAIAAPDNCGTTKTVDCGTAACTGGTTCNATSNTCEATCTPETVAEFCARLAGTGKVCGAIADQHNCTGAARTEDCGTAACTGGTTCNPASNTCEATCTPETVEEFCARLAGSGKICGAIADQHNCTGAARTEDCGSAACTGATTCQPDNTCACLAESDAEFCARQAVAGRVCGSIAAPDNCGAAKTVDCGLAACTGGTTCNPVSNTCEAACVPETVAEFCARLAGTGKVCGSIADQHNCTGAARTEDCGNGACIGATVCDPAANACVSRPDNDSCAGAIALSFTADEATATGTTVHALDDSQGSCSAAPFVHSGGDVAYRFTVPAGQDRTATVKVTRDPGSPAFQPAVYLRSACESALPADERGCAGTETGGTSTLTALLAPGDYYVVVDGESGTAGAFGLEVSLSPVLNDTCDFVQALDTSGLDANGNGTLTVSGDTSLATASGSSSCGGQGPDLVYSLTLAAPKDVQVAMSFADPTLDAVVYLRRGACTTTSSTDEVECASGKSPASFSLVQLGAGTYHLWADGFSASSGPFTLTVTLADPPTTPANDTCAAAQDLGVADGQTTTVAGTTRGAFNDSTATCATSSVPFTGGDVVYKFTLATAQSIVAKVTPDAAWPSFRPAVYVLGNCPAVGGDEAACGRAPTASAPARLSHHSLAAGTYYLVVDGVSGSDGDFTLELTAAAPYPIPDTCVDAFLLSGFDAAGNGTVTVDGNTSLAADDATGTCRADSTYDLVYAFDVPAGKTKDVTAKMTFANSSAYALVYLRRDCASTAPADELACVDSGKALASARAIRLTEGRYYVFADGQTSETYDKGPFTLEVTLGDSPPAPANDTCAAPQSLGALAAGASLSAAGDSFYAANDLALSACGATSGGDLVYSFTLAAPAAVSAVVTPGAGATGYRPAVSLRSACQGAAADELACGTAAGGAAATAAAARLPAGTHYVVVDGLNGTAGSFTLEVSAAAAATLPEDCSAAQPLSGFDADGNGTVIVNADTTGARNDATGTCRTSSGPELVYSFAVPAGKLKEVNVSMTFAGAALPHLYVRSACLSAQAAHQVGCSAATSSTGTLALHALGPGRYHLFADSTSSSAAGAFGLQVTISDTPQTPANDTCAGALDLGVVDLQSTLVTGTTVSATNDSTASCATSTAPFSGGDVVYRLTLGTEQSLVARVKPDLVSPTFRPAVYLLGSCPAAGDEAACGKAPAAGGSAMLTLNSLAAGTYFLVVDGVAASSGGFALELTAAAPFPVPDGCASAYLLTGFDADGNGTVLVSGDTTLATNDATGTCKSTTANDLVYAFDVPAGKTKEVSAKMTFTSGANLWPMVYLRGVCGSSASELACASVGSTIPATAVAHRVGPGRYYVFADAAYSSDKGPFTLEVTISDTPPPPANDTCAAAQGLGALAVGATVTASGETSYAFDDLQVSACGTTTGGDVVYSFTLAAPAAVTATVTPAAEAVGYRPAVALRSACPGSSADDAACGSAATAGAAATASAALLPAGTHYVIVDGLGGTGGAFTLELAAGAAATGPEDCSSAQLLSGFDAQGNGTVSVAGDTTGARDDASGTCDSTTGAELVYAFDVQAGTTKEVVATLAFAGGANPNLYVRSACLSAQSWDQLGCVTSTTGSATAMLHALGPGRYFLFADATSATAQGAFTLEVSISDTPMAPANDLCADALPLAAGPIDGTSVTALGSTWSGADDYAGACATAAAPMSGADVVYSFTLAAPAAVTAKVTPVSSSSYRPAVYLRSSCPGLATDEAACAQAGTAGSSTTATAAALPAGTWFVVVDGALGTEGGFRLEVSAASPATPANDDCSSPELLTGFDGAGNGTVSVDGDTTGARNAATGGCRTSSGLELVYAVDVPAGTTKDLLATLTYADSGNDAHLYLRRACTSVAAADELGCADPGAALAQVKAHALPAGRYFLFADGRSSYYDAGAFTLEVTLSDPPQPPPNDVCAAATPGSAWDLTGALAAGGGQVSVGGDTSAALDDYSGTCNGTTGTAGGDVVYTFTLTAPASLVARVTPDASAVGWQPAVYLRSVCASPSAADERACAVSSTTAAVAARAPGLAPGTYFLVVDGLGGTAGAFTLDLELGAVPANDTCATATDLGDLSLAPASATGSTYFADLSAQPTSTCTSTASGADVVYAFNTGAAPKWVLATATATTAELKPLVYLRSACASSTPELACEYKSAAGASASVLATGLTASTPYFAWVDGHSGSMGPYRLDVAAIDPAPAVPTNDTCVAPDGAIALALDVPVAGNTSTGTHNYPVTSLPSSCSSKSFPGKELVYSYTPTAPGAFRVTVVPTASFDVGLWISTGCGEGAGCIAQADPGYGGDSESITVANPTVGTTYYLHVDSYSSSAAGDFGIVVRSVP